MSLAQKLEQGLIQAGLEITAEKQQQLLAYLALIQKWNKVHNLTAVRDPEQMVILHLLDSLVVMPHIKVKRLLDVGSGAGLPGIPLAICMPDLQVTTLDSNQKKASFMRQAKAELGLSNLEIVSTRVEQYQPTEKFEAIISRAFSDLSLFVGLTKHLCADNGSWLAMKGVIPEDELLALKAKTDIEPTATLALEVPFLDAQRHLLFLPNKIQ